MNVRQEREERKKEEQQILLLPLEGRRLKLKGSRLFQGFCFLLKRKSSRPLRVWRINTWMFAKEALGQKGKEKKTMSIPFLSLFHLSLLIPL